MYGSQYSILNMRPSCFHGKLHFLPPFFTGRRFGFSATATIMKEEGNVLLYTQWKEGSSVGYKTSCIFIDMSQNTIVHQDVGPRTECKQDRFTLFK